MQKMSSRPILLVVTAVVFSPLPSAALIMGLDADYSDFPWLCFLKYRKEHFPFGSCTIFSDHWMITSADVWNMQSRGPNEPYIYYVHKAITEGKETNFAVYPAIASFHDRSEDYVQIKDVYIAKSHLVADSKPWGLEYAKVDASELFLQNPQNFSDIEMDLLGAAVNIAIVETLEGLSYSWHTLPIPMTMTYMVHIEENLHAYRESLEQNPHAADSCLIAGIKLHMNRPDFWKGNLFYHHMTYIPIRSCQEVYCSADPAYCMHYPYQKHHVCFQSNMYTGMCQTDDGVALYCPAFNKSVFAILSNADNCGLDSLPSVYTLINVPYRLWIAIRQRGDPYMHVAKVDHKLYPRPPPELPDPPTY